MGMAYKIVRGDCRAALRDLPDASVDSVVTDPPYEIGFMGRAWDRTGVAFSPEVWGECLRVLKPGGYLLSFASPRTCHRIACAIEDAGFQIADQILWLYGQGMPKSGNLKPAHEPIIAARKPLEGTREQNVSRYGTGKLNIDACRILGTSSASADFDASKGRYPANLLHDGTPEVVAVFPNNNAGCKPHRVKSSSESVAALQEKGWGFAGSDKIAGFDDGDDLSASRFFYCAKANGKERDAGLGGFDVKRCGGMQATADGSMLTGSGNPRTTSRANTHPTVKPVDLMRYLCRLVTPPGGVVVDPFAGSGSTGVAAILEGFRPILIEEDGGDQSLGYVDIINARCMHALLGDLL